MNTKELQLTSCQKKFLDSKRYNGTDIEYFCNRNNLIISLIITNRDDKMFVESAEFVDKLKQAIINGCKNHGCKYC